MIGTGQNKSDQGETVVLVVGGEQSRVAEALREGGFAVDMTSDGLKAFEQIHEHVPAVIVVDCASSQEGIEVCRRLKENMAARDIPVIFVARSGDGASVKGARAAGANDHFFTPFDAEDLLARVRLNLDLVNALQELRRSENRMREMKAEKNEFLSIVAHDLRSPLSNIVTSADIVAQDSEEMPREQVKEFAEIICASGKHMIHLVENLMDLNAIEQGRMKMEIAPLELGEIVRGVAANYDAKAKAKQQKLSFVEEDGPLVAMADPHSAIQIFNNLLSNAIKYSPMGKRIDIRLRPNNGMIRCEVRDEGPGLSKEDLQKMFGKFAKLSPRPTGGEPSTGLGLSIVKKMVEAAGGNVWCESEPGKGSTFVVELRSAAPVVDVAAAAVAVA
ncbi:MAG TPA: HAMP domain-containing sensor histidine kinase [Verrucomicrobiae bacterium]|nr:HAMP domain-containing sensor histidine kinase [Verrucomicrobiae bacterium]